MSIDEDIEKKIKETGIDLNAVRESGLYVQVNDDIVKTIIVKQLEKKGIVVKRLGDALRELPWVKDYLWKAIGVKKGDISPEDEKIKNGYFIYVPPNTRVDTPIEACFLVTKPGHVQEVHNLVIVDENSSLEMVTGCTAAISEGLHLGISEFFVKRNARLLFTMLHNWTPNFKVRPITKIIVEENGEYIENYINLAPGAWMKANPHITLMKNARAHSQSLIIGRGGADIDYGSTMELMGDGSRGDIISRVITFDKSKIVSRGKIVAVGKGTAGHIECKGLMISDESSIHAIPELVTNTIDATLTHEASIGKISKEQIEYLMARGFTEDEATGLIIRGFMNIELKGVNEAVKKTVLGILDKISKSEGM